MRVLFCLLKSMRMLLSRRSIPFFVSILVLFSACGPEEPPLPDFQRVLAVTQSNGQYRYTEYDLDLVKQKEVNLSDELSFNQAFRLTLTEGEISVVTFEGSVLYDVRSINTGNLAVDIGTQVCIGSTPFFVDEVRTRNQYTLLSVYTTDLNGAVNGQFVFAYNRIDNSCAYISYPELPSQIDRSPEIEIRGNRAFFLMENFDTNNFELYSLDLTTRTFSEPKLFAQSENFRLVVRDDRLYAFYIDGRLEELSSSDLSVLNSSSHGVNFGLFGPNRLFSTQIQGNRMLVDVSYPQPGSIGSGPGIVDITTGEFEGDSSTFFFTLQENLQKTYSSVSISSVYTADINTGLVTAVAQVFDGSSTSSLLVFTDFSGRVLGTDSIDNQTVVALFMAD